IVTLSPVVPQGTSNFTPPLTCRSANAENRSSSIEPSLKNGVTSAVAHPRIQSIRFVINFEPCRSRRVKYMISRQETEKRIAPSHLHRNFLHFRSIRLLRRPLAFGDRPEHSLF